MTLHLPKTIVIIYRSDMGAGGSTASQALDESFLNDIPDDKRDKIKQKFKEQVDLYGLLNDKYEKFKAESGIY